jgi:hypothetical protein
VRGVVLLLGLAVGLSALIPNRASAQPSLNITSSSIDLPTPTAVEYDAGYTLVGRLTFEVTGCGSPQQRCTLGLWAATPFVGASKPVAEVEWQLDDVADDRWQSLSAVPSDGNVGVMSGQPVRVGTLYFRMRLAWAEDRAGESILAALRLTLTNR